jgi:hypothetical protein
MFNLCPDSGRPDAAHGIRADQSPTREEMNVEEKRSRNFVHGGIHHRFGDTCDITVVQSSMSNQHNYSPGRGQ